MGNVIIQFHMNTFVREGVNTNHSLKTNLKKNNNYVVLFNFPTLFLN